MGFWIGRGRKARRAYGLDEIALAPGSLTVDPEDTDTSWEIGGHKFSIPVIAAAMDGVVDVPFAIKMGQLGGFAILNLEGVQTRYEDPAAVLEEIAKSDPTTSTSVLQKVYQAPIREELISRRIEEIKAAGVKAVVSSIPQRAQRFGAIAQEAGVDIFVVQSTVTTVQYKSSKHSTLDFKKFITQEMRVPVIVGNTVTSEPCLELMECEPAGVLVGVGPGEACTTRGVLGLGVPQVTATADCAWARDYYYKKTGRFIPIITDGGMSKGGDICKAFACGADAVVVGSAFAKSTEAPGRGYHWGMATPHHNLPRGTRVHVGTTGSLEEILYGPARLDDGSQNIVGAIKTCMGSIGALTIKEFQEADIIIAPSIKQEGKLYQRTQHIGMNR
ncbi:MAG: GuaB3 family IMP dehydrogenase-related protein [Candidatus Sumerlaeia bacterium]|nr:GuaB3 family IMP dehydrogenase-related protein [Candidatus Sumerlaeia bacterium]